MSRRIISARRGGAILVLLLVCLALAGLVYDELSSREIDLPKPALPAGAAAPVSLPKGEEAVSGLPPIETLAGSTLVGLELGKLSFPETKDVRFDSADSGYIPDLEVQAIRDVGRLDNALAGKL